MPNQPDRNSHAQIDKTPSNGKSYIRGCTRRFFQCRIPVEYGLRLKIRSSTAYTKTDKYSNQYGDYSFFMGVSGLLTYIRWKYPWILCFSTVVGAVFALVNILKPEIHDQSLMPALQSPWFIPHVTIYMFSYSVLGCAFILSCMGLFKRRVNYLEAADKLVYTGLAFLTVGMLTGAIWAKAAWGHYWSWDPKETWAAVTWTGYLLYVHLRLFRSSSPRVLYWILIVSFLSLQMCWYGVNYLPAARQSVHLYSRS